MCLVPNQTQLDTTNNPLSDLTTRTLSWIWPRWIDRRFRNITKTENEKSMRKKGHTTPVVVQIEVHFLRCIEMRFQR